MSRLSPSLACAAAAAAALHVLLWLAWPNAGVTGRADAMARVAADLHGRGERIAQMIVRTGMASSEESLAVDGAAATAGRGRQDDGRGNDEGEQAVQAVQAELGARAWLSASYLEADQLDRSPRPVHGWSLDEELLTSVGRTHLLVKLWVSSEGGIDHVEVLQAEPPGAWVARALRSLPATAMEPAVKQGRPVAAIVVVELQTENEQVH